MLTGSPVSIRCVVCGVERENVVLSSEGIRISDGRECNENYGPVLLWHDGRVVTKCRGHEADEAVTAARLNADRLPNSPWSP